jgi:hypothetical protein
VPKTSTSVFPGKLSPFFHPELCFWFCWYGSVFLCAVYSVSTWWISKAWILDVGSWIFMGLVLVLGYGFLIVLDPRCLILFEGFFHIIWKEDWNFYDWSVFFFLSWKVWLNLYRRWDLDSQVKYGLDGMINWFKVYFFPSILNQVTLIWSWFISFFLQY